jgi:hypothetical protein
MGTKNSKEKIAYNPEKYIANYYLENLILENKNINKNNNENIKEIYENLYSKKYSKKEQKNILYT